MIHNHDEEDSDVEYIDLKRSDEKIYLQICYSHNDGRRHTEFFNVTEEIDNLNT